MADTLKNDVRSLSEHLDQLNAQSHRLSQERGGRVAISFEQRVESVWRDLRIEDPTIERDTVVRALRP